MLGNYLITEDTTMKAFKKLMAAALVCVMALTMLTGCGVADKKSKKNMVKALNDIKNSTITYESSDKLDSKADDVLAKAAKSGKIKDATLDGKYSIYYEKLPGTWNSTSDLDGIATRANAQFIKENVKVTDKKASVGVAVKEVNKDNYILLIVETN